MDTTIDWEDQWACHAPNFSDGLAYVHLPNGMTIFLRPGPGFGDFSHPTTRLMIGMMPPYVPGREIFDIGCGSGILSIASAKMGAKKICCVDIDKDALAHTHENATLNNVVLTEKSSRKAVVLMNMISSEQEAAWQEHQCPFHTLITAGVLKSDRDSYLQFASFHGWVPYEERESDGWLGFVFKEKL